MISVIVVTYNQQHTIGRTLDSILSQRCHVPFEIIIGEDCSTDDTRAVCETYARQHPEQIRLFARQQNRGLVDNYYDCLLEAKGDFIADCAGDDYWTDPLKLEKQLCVMEKHPEVTLCHTAWEHVHAATGARSASPRQPFADSITDGRQMLTAIITQTTMPIVHLCTAMYRADVFRKSYEADNQLFRNPAAGCEDLQLVATMAYNGKIAYLPDVTTAYSCDEETVSASTDEQKQFRFVQRVTSQSFDLARRFSLRGPLIDRYFSYRIFALSMHAFRTHNKALRKETLCLEETWNAHRRTATRIVLAVTSNRFTWELALALRSVYKLLKG